MSQSMNTTAGPVGELAPPSKSRWWAIAVGIGVAAILGYGAALIATDHLPGSDHLVAGPTAAVATPQVESGAVAQSNAGADDLATRSAAGATGAVGASGVVARSYAGADDLATRSPVTAQSYAGADDLATRAAVGTSGIVIHSALDPFEERSDATAGAAIGTLWGTEFSDPAELYPAIVGTSGVVAHGALDPFETRVDASPEAISESSSQPTVGYLDGQWHVVTLENPVSGYSNGQWHAE